jgi:amino acid adenylation domain-containing protein
MAILRRKRVAATVAPPEPEGAAVPDLVRARAAASPGSVALATGSEALTYHDLDSRGNQVANYLRSLGVGPGVLVGLCLPRSLDMVVGALGILKAGGAYVPMDPAYPAGRLTFMLDDAQAPVLISSPGLVQRLPVAKREILYLDDPAIASQPVAAPAVAVAQDDLAYVIYTSGSTGRPKGVEIAHRGLTNLISWHVQAFAVTAADRASHLAGLGFDAAVWELWPYLAVGASVHLADEETRNSAELLWEWLMAQRISISFVPTPLAERLLSLNLKWPRKTTLRILLTGGDTLHHYPPPGLPFLLVNNYGPTECTVVTTSGPVLPNRSPAARPPIGHPIANTRIHLLDESLRPVLPGAAGEIYIGGAGVARGYHNRPDLTAERFIPGAVGAERDGRLYKTGDLGRLLPDGRIEFVGRLDDQIKIRGYRIEPNEVVSVLNRHAAIRASAVVAREDTAGERQLVAYITLDPVADLTLTGLREFLRDVLPEYMIPAAFVCVDALPLTPHGKIDRAGLPEPVPANTLQDDRAEEPCTETEQRVAECVAELLNLEAVGLDDNFFLLGGHSLLGAQLLALLRDEFGVEITLRSLFEAPTVAALAAELDRRRSTVVGSPG